MAGTADDQGLTLARGHHLDPFGFVARHSPASSATPCPETIVAGQSAARSVSPGSARCKSTTGRPTPHRVHHQRDPLGGSSVLALVVLLTLVIGLRGVVGGYDGPRWRDAPIPPGAAVRPTNMTNDSVWVGEFDTGQYRSDVSDWYRRAWRSDGWTLIDAQVLSSSTEWLDVLVFEQGGKRYRVTIFWAYLSRQVTAVMIEQARR